MDFYKYELWSLRFSENTIQKNHIFKKFINNNIWIQVKTTVETTDYTNTYWVSSLCQALMLSTSTTIRETDIWQQILGGP